MIEISKNDTSAIEKWGITEIDIELTTRCNSHCIMCPNYRLPRIEMAINDVSSIIKLLTKKIRCDFVGLGEPLLHPHYETAFRNAAEASEWVFVSTNAINLDEKQAARLIETGIHKIGVSMDGANPETYRSMRGIDGFEGAIVGVRNLVKARNRLGRKEGEIQLPQIQFCFVMLKRNLPDLLKVIELAARLGVDMVRVQNPLPEAKILSEVPYPIPGICQLSDDLIKRFRSILSDAKKFAEKLQIKFYDEEIGKTFHEHGETDLNIASNGDLTICNSCRAGFRIIKSKVEKFRWVIGNLHSNSLAELLESEKYQSFRKTFAKGDCPEACRGCLGWNDVWW